MNIFNVTERIIMRITKSLSLLWFSLASYLTFTQYCGTRVGAIHKQVR